MTAHRTGRVRATLMAGALALSLGACGVSDALVGLHPAPSESRARRRSTSRLPPPSPRASSARRSRARSATGPTAKTKRADVLVGDAPHSPRWSGPRRRTEAPLTATPEPTVPADVLRASWPRAMLVGTLDEATATQYLHVLVSATAEGLPARLDRPDAARCHAAGPGSVTDGASYLTGASKETIGELSPGGRGHGIRLGAHGAPTGQGRQAGRGD
ncbi:MAG: hypothetical protein IPL94_09910 [Tetrasphaera sp.]|nr:hypothetical protein [Tetrasphaera sp.]